MEVMLVERPETAPPETGLGVCPKIYGSVYRRGAVYPRHLRGVAVSAAELDGADRPGPRRRLHEMLPLVIRNYAVLFATAMVFNLIYAYTWQTLQNRYVVGRQECRV